jgi:hypothetical protein
MKALDRALLTTAGVAEAPLVIAATHTEAAAYRQASTHPLLLAEGIDLSPDAGWTDDSLVRRAWSAIGAWTDPRRERIIEQFRNLAGTAKAPSEAHAIVRAAADGKVENLLLAPAGRVLGDYMAITGKTALAGSFRNGSEDLANAAIVDTLRQSGKVWIAEAERIPDGATLAAVLRY